MFWQRGKPGGRKGNLMMKNDDVRTVGKELILGLIAYGVIVQIILLFFSARMYHAIGLWIGVIIGIVSSIHMRVTLEEAMAFEEKDAALHIRKRYIIRYLLIMAVLGAVLYFRIGSILTVLVGIFGLKISAYLQPVTHKVVSKCGKMK